MQRFMVSLASMAAVLMMKTWHILDRDVRQSQCNDVDPARREDRVSEQKRLGPGIYIIRRTR
jgi:hypothetical protein